MVFNVFRVEAVLVIAPSLQGVSVISTHGTGMCETPTTDRHGQPPPEPHHRVQSALLSVKFSIWSPPAMLDPSP